MEEQRKSHKGLLVIGAVVVILLFCAFFFLLKKYRLREIPITAAVKWKKNSSQIYLRKIF